MQKSNHSILFVQDVKLELNISKNTAIIIA